MRQNNVFSLLDIRLQRVIKQHGYKEPTLVQALAIPLILNDYNVLITAPTGSGKTEAALFPIMSRIINNRLAGIRALYITPLKSLNRDVFYRMTRIADEVGLSLSVRHGDSSSTEKKIFLQNPPSIAIMTPETFYLLLSSALFRRALRYLEYIVIDEVHELISSKRGVELSLAVERADAFYSKKRIKIIALSATLSKPSLVAQFIMGHRLYKIVDVGQIVKHYKINVDLFCNDNECVNSSGSELNNLRISYVTDIIKKVRGNILLFTNTRDTAEVLGAMLRQKIGEAVRVHHGSLSKEERIESERYFREGKVRLLIATSSLELGIDIGRINLVIQYMSPRQALKLVQRVGRASHRFNLTSKGIILSAANIFDILESAVIAARAMRGNLESPYIHIYALDALIHQVTGMVIEKGSLNLLEVYNTITRSRFYENLDFDEFIQALNIAETVGIIRLKGNMLRLGPRSKSYYFSTTMITESRQYDVIDIVSGKKIGVLDEEFVATLGKGDVFVLAGRVWEVVDIRDEKVRVIVRKDYERLMPPAWEGELIPVEYSVAREVGSIFRRYIKEGSSVLRRYPLSDRAREFVEDKLSKYLDKIGLLPSDRVCVVEHYGDVFIMYSFLGSRGNKALEYLFSSYIAETEGYNPSVSSTPYIVAVRLSSHRPLSYVKQVIYGIMNLDNNEIVELVKKAIRKSKIFEWTLYKVGIRSGAIPSEQNDISVMKRALRRIADTILGEEALREILVRKVDLNALLIFIDELKRGRRELKLIELKEASTLTEDAVSEARFSDRIAAKQIPSTILAEAVKRRLSRKEVYLVCMMCGSLVRKTISELNDIPQCPQCGSRLIAPFTNIDEAKKIVAIIKKRKRGASLTKGEIKLLKNAYEKANIVIDYGRKGIEALSWIGVGPSTARKVLKKLVFSEEAFYKALIEAEIHFHKYKHKLEQK